MKAKPPEEYKACLVCGFNKKCIYDSALLFLEKKENVCARCAIQGYIREYAIRVSEAFQEEKDSPRYKKAFQFANISWNQIQDYLVFIENDAYESK